MPAGQLRLLLGVVAVVAAMLVYGLGFFLFATFTTPTTAPTPASTPTVPDDPQQRRDLIAAAPMLQVPVNAGMTPGVAISSPPAIALPDPASVGPQQVPAGFPHTPLGAVAQLAALDQLVLTTMSIPLATAVYQAWSMPGAPDVTVWEQTRNIASFLTHAHQTGPVKDPGVLVSVTPAAYQIKGVDGPDWVLACVLFDVRAALNDQAQTGYGTCERMQWATDRWMIAAGSAPARAPSTWPGSDLALQAGWQPLTR